MKNAYLLLIPFIILNAGCSGDSGAAGGFSMPPTAVEVAEVKVQNVADKFEAVGSIEAEESITVVAEIDATVLRLPFKEGASIKEGELIAQLDDSQYSAELSRARAVLAQNKASFARIKKIVGQGAGAPQDLDDAAANLKVAQANVAVAEARFDKTRIVAPFSGVIGARRVSVGTFLRVGQTITEMANINSIRVNFSAPERFLGLLKPGAEVLVATTAFPGYELKGAILAIDPIIDSATRSARVVARLANPDQKFRAGMSANVTVIMSERPNSLTIPSESVFARGSVSFVFTVKEDSTVSRTAIVLGSRMADAVEVVQGLKPGMKVVRAGHQKLFEGARVMPITSMGTNSE